MSAGAPGSRPRPSLPIVVSDDFHGSVPPGKLIGTLSTSGHPRLGADPEKVLSMDRSGLRIGGLSRPGWGRSCVAYGPVALRPGLVLSVHVLNGHQASQGYRLRRLAPRLVQWVQGSRTVRPSPARLVRLLRANRRLSAARRLRGWARNTGTSDSPLARRVAPLARRRTRLEAEAALADNLVVGLFDGPVASDLSKVVAGFRFRSRSELSGDLDAVTGGRTTSVLDRLTGVPIHLVAIIRQDSVLYGAASVGQVRGLPAHPAVRPLLIDPLPGHSFGFPAVQQIVSGEIGFSVDTRVFGLKALEVDALGAWFAGAHLADSFQDSGRLDGIEPPTGPQWTVIAGALERGSEGLVASRGSVALSELTRPSGLLRIRIGPAQPGFALLWRAKGPTSHWRLELADERFRLGNRIDGVDHWLAVGMLPHRAEIVQVIDDHDGLRILVDDVAVATVAAPADLAFGDGVGLEALTDGSLGVSALEAYPTELHLPTDFLVGTASDLPQGEAVVVHDAFDGAPRPQLDGRPVPQRAVWRRTLGSGRFTIEGPGSVRIESCPNRTAYTVAAHPGGIVDLTTVITAPSGPDARSRAGLIAFQDAGNMLCVNLWFNDRSDRAASVSSFLTIDGHEDVYDAVWVNVGDRVLGGRPVEMRLITDGALYQVYLDDELVLWRRVEDVYPGAPALRFSRVGLLANWEWGLDTGSRFGCFTYRTGPGR